MYGDREPIESPGVEHAETLTLAEQRDDLTAAVDAGRDVPAGRLWGLPELPDDDVRVDVAGASVLAGVEPRTITGWLTRHGPKRNPFPQAVRLLYRLYRPMSAVRAWRQIENGNGAMTAVE